MTGNLQPLDEKFPIVDQNGRPTIYFVRWAQQRQIDIEDSVSAAQALEIAQKFVLEFLGDHPLVAGSGIDLSPSGNIADGVTISAQVQAILDQLSTTQGAVLFRGAADWEALAPGTAGDFLKTNGAGADPEWGAAGGGGGSAWTLIGSTVIAAPTATIEFDLTGYNEVIVVIDAVTTTVTSIRNVQVSVNGGSTWITTYNNIDANGAVGSAAFLQTTSSVSGVRSSLTRLLLAAPYIYFMQNRNISGIIGASPNTINRVRIGAGNTSVFSNTNMTAGTVSAFGR